MELSQDALLTAVADPQLGTFTTEQAEACGLSRSALLRRAERDLIACVHQGVWAFKGHPFTWRRRIHAGLLAGGPTSAACRMTAAMLWRINGELKSGVAHVLIDHDRRVRLGDRATRIHRSRTLRPEDVVTLDGIRVTSLARTVVDLAMELTTDQLREVAARALRTKLVTIDDLCDQLDRAGSIRGARRLARVLVGLHPDLAKTRADSETRLHRLILNDRRLPIPTLGYVVRRPDGEFIRELDLSYPPLEIDIEADGYEWHSTPAQKRRDNWRDNQMAALAWFVLHFSPRDTKEHPRAVLNQTLAVVEQRERERGIRLPRPGD